ncbi:MAG: hypothetical protein JOY71_22070 [Acetobacteraceae bacterium]|nr:hypothetical protein [Acetobacteraceae bacterium]
MAASQPATSLSHRLGLTIAGLCEALAARMARDRTAVPLLFLAWTRLRRLAVRFEALLADFRVGRLPAARARRSVENLPQLPNLAGLPPPYRAPRESGWLLRLAPESAAFAGQVEYLLADSEMKALLAASPQAGRMLRPLCRMLGIRAGLEVLAVRGEPATSPAKGVGLGDTAAAAAGSPNTPARAIAPAWATAPGSECASTGCHFAGQNGGPGFGSRAWPAPSARHGQPARTPVVGAEAGADPPPALSWGRAEPG